MAKADYYVVLQSFSTTVDDRSELYREGEIVGGDDPVVKKSPHLFGPITVRGAATPAPTPVAEPEPEPAVEQASAAPGEKREVAPPTGKAITTDSLKGRSH